MSGESDLAKLLAGMRPELHASSCLFCLVRPEQLKPGLQPVATFREAEGLTLVLEKSEARRHGIEGIFESAWITLTVHSDLAAVGFLAVVATALAKEGIPCNAIAAYHHDHLFVPVDRAQDALAILTKLQKVESPRSDP
ncbi:MAG: ACT domain-containing protein [Thermoanaerobaculia bacterium]